MAMHAFALQQHLNRKTLAGVFPALALVDVDVSGSFKAEWFRNAGKVFHDNLSYVRNEVLRYRIVKAAKDVGMASNPFAGLRRRHRWTLELCAGRALHVE
jgi:hypothetical protein